MTPRPMEARNPDAWAMRADPAPHEPVATRPPSPWQVSAPWVEDTTAAPAEYLAGVMSLGFGATVVQVNRGGLSRDREAAAQVERYRRFGPVYGWGRCDQRHDADERADPIDVAHTVIDACQRLGISTYAANTEIRWDTTDHRLFLGTLDHQAPHLLDNLAVCTYPGGMPDDAHQLYLQRGLLTILITVLPANGAPTEANDAIRLASVTYGVPETEMRAVAWCESRMNPRAHNRSSGARGLMQFIPSTWRATPYRRLDVFSPYANALAAGWLYVKSGRSWRQWSCKP